MSIGTSSVKELITNHSKFVIVSHQSPDGDAVGSATGLARVLTNLTKEVVIVLPDPPSAVLLPFLSEVTCYFYNEKPTECESVMDGATVLFALDFNTISRVGEALRPHLDSFQGKKVMIDHHQNPDNFADVLLSDTENTSTCQLVYETLERMNLDYAIDLVAARALYLGMMTDTGSFRYPSVTSETHSVISKLIGYGIRPFEIHEQVFDHQSMDQLQLRGYAVSKVGIVFFFSLCLHHSDRRRVEPI